MDFKRVKLIFIITFLVLNLFLLHTYIERYNSARLAPNEQVFNVLDQLAKNNVTLPKDVSADIAYIPNVSATVTPERFANRSRLANQEVSITATGALQSTLSAPVALKLTNGVLVTEDFQTLSAFLADEKNVLYGQEYGYFTHLPNENQIIYTQYSNRTALADGTAQIVFQLNGSNVVGYTQTYVADIATQGSAREDIVSRRDALKALYLENLIPNDAIVKRFELVYVRTVSVDTLSVYGQVWYLEMQLKDGSLITRRVDAHSGKVLTAPRTVPAADQQSGSSSESQSQ